MKCERCGKETRVFVMSMFNTENICMACRAKEKMHPLYDNAKKVEREHVMAGDYNFSGIGKPSDL